MCLLSIVEPAADAKELTTFTSRGLLFDSSCSGNHKLLIRCPSPKVGMGDGERENQFNLI